MPQVFIENFAEWKARHGGDSIGVNGGEILFPDGASCNDRFSIRREAPTNDSQRLSMISQFWKAKMQAAEQELVNARNQFMWQAHFAARSESVAPPPPNAGVILKSLLDVVMAHRQKWCEAEQALAKTPERAAHEHYQHRKAQRHQEMELIKNQIRGFQIPDLPHPSTIQEGTEDL